MTLTVVLNGSYLKLSSSNAKDLITSLPKKTVRELNILGQVVIFEPEVSSLVKIIKT